MSFGPLHDLFQKIYEDPLIAQDESGRAYPRPLNVPSPTKGLLSGLPRRSQRSTNMMASDRSGK